MTDRSVVVRLRMAVSEYVSSSRLAGAETRRLADEQRQLGAAGRKTDKDMRVMSGGLKVGAAALGILGASGAAIKILPPLLAATATGAAALPGVLGGAAAGVTVLKVATKGLGKELGNVLATDDPFARLAPSAKALVAETVKLKPALLAVQGGLQERALKGTAAGLNLIATKGLPAVQGGLNDIADDWADLFAEIALAVSDPEFAFAFNTVTDSADRFFDQVTDRIRPTAQAIGTLVTAADPVVRAVGDSFAGMLDRFASGVAKAKRSGSLDDFFDAGAESARELLSIGESVVRMTGMVISATAKQKNAGRTAADTLEAYIASGRAAEDITGAVDTLTKASEGLTSVLGPLATALRDALANPGTAQSIEQIFAILSTGAAAVATVVDLFVALNNATGGLLVGGLAVALLIAKIGKAMDLLERSADKGAKKLGQFGQAGADAGKGLKGLAKGVGVLGIALVGLELADLVLSEFLPASADADKLTASLAAYAKTGKWGGEVTKVFGENLDDLGAKVQSVQNGWMQNLGRGLEQIPVVGTLTELMGGSFASEAEDLAALDEQLAKYAATTKDYDGAQKIWNEAFAKSKASANEFNIAMPKSRKALEDLNREANSGAGSMAALAERTELLSTPLEKTVSLARSLVDVFGQLNGPTTNFALAQAQAEESLDNLTAGLGKNGLALNKSKTDFNTRNDAGRQNLTLTTALAAAAVNAANLEKEKSGSIEKSAAVYQRYITQLRAALAAEGARPETIDAIIAAYAKMPAEFEVAATAANNLTTKLNQIPKGTKFEFNGESLTDGNGKTIDLKNGLDGLPKGKTFTWDGKSLVDGKGKAFEVRDAVQEIPGKKTVDIASNADGTTQKMKDLGYDVEHLPDGRVVVTADTSSAETSLAQLRANFALMGAGYQIPVTAGPSPKPSGSRSQAQPKAAGGVSVRAAADGLLRPEIAPPGTRYQWAEPETGGEAFIPRNGIDRRRGREILGVAASWYDGMFVPMARGGTTAAAAGLVNVAPGGARDKASPLDSAERYLRARDAVKSLNASLTENGRSFSLATKKGQENTSAVYAAIRAAQDAAATKYEETGSVTAANAVYAQHIKRLRDTLAQQKVNAATIRSLMALAGPPSYDTAGSGVRAPANSLTNVAFAKAAVGAAAGIDDLRDKLSLNRPGMSLSTPEGRENLLGIIDFLEQAASAAQSRYEQTGNTKTATTLYGTYIGQLREALKAAGFTTAMINDVITRYGRITLTKNARGGVYMAQGGVMSLAGAGIYQAGSSPLYGFAEPGTGGEAFIPRHGDRQRGRDLLDVAAGWYGGKFSTGAGGGKASSYDYSTHLTVTPLTYNPTTSELRDFQRQLDSEARVGRPR